MSEQPMATRPALRAFVEAARAQPIAPVRLSAHAVQRAWADDQNQRRHTRKVLALGVVLGMAAALVGVIVAAKILGSPEPTPLAGFGEDVDLDLDGPSKIGPSKPSPVAADLDLAIRIRSDAHGESLGVLGPWSIVLAGPGVHEITVQPSAGRALRITLAEPSERTLELVHGRLVVEQLDATLVRLESGVAAWLEADGTRTQIQVERVELEPELEPEPEPNELSATELARKAERQLIAGSREQAIATLRKLVRKYPQTPQARTALMDLAAQEKLAGDADRARCAYQLYVEQWPHSAVRAEIDERLATLGEGPACRGLDPR